MIAALLVGIPVCVISVCWAIQATRITRALKVIRFAQQEMRARMQFAAYNHQAYYVTAEHAQRILERIDGALLGRPTELNSSVISGQLTAEGGK